MERGGFSPATVLLSFFMVAGGICFGLLALRGLAPAPSDGAIVVAFAAGGLAGGVLAAGAGRAPTLAGPLLGAALACLTLGGMLSTTAVARLLPGDPTRDAIASSTAAFAAALVGAALSARLSGARLASSLWAAIRVAVAVAGGCFLSFLAAGLVRFASFEPASVSAELATDRASQATIFAGIVGACLLTGLAAGAAATRRARLAWFLGAAAGVLVFFLAATSFRGQRVDGSGVLGAGVVALGGGLVTWVSGAVGWAVGGRRRGGGDAPVA